MVVVGRGVSWIIGDCLLCDSGGDNMNVEDLIKRHEGFSDRVYLCTEGIPTVGWGHALHVGTLVPMGTCELFFEQDIRKVYEDYLTLGLNLDEVRKAVVVNMIFNLGISGFRKFKRTIKLIKDGNYTKAGAEMLRSKWAGQVGKRANELSEMMITGDWPGRG